MPYRPSEPEDYRDRDWLYEKYHGERLSSADIADLCDCHKSTILRWLDEHGIEKRTQSEATEAEWEGDEERREEFRLNVQPLGARAGGWRRRVMPFGTTKEGYEKWKSNGEEFSVHRLLAIAEYGADAVAGKHVHHRNELKWDNRPSNIELRDPGDHVRHHEPWEG